MTGCNCWVASRPAEEQFAIRYGAHSLSCPLFRASLDPVDQLNDADLRRTNPHEIHRVICESRFTVGTEAELQEALADLLARHGILYEREVILSTANRIDILSGDCGIEVKIGGSRADLARQLQRYAGSYLISSLVVVTTKSQHASLEGSLMGKPVLIAYIGGAL